MQTAIVEQHKHNIVYLVSHMDIAKDHIKAISEINAYMDKIEMPQQVVYYSNERCHPAHLASTLYLIASSFPPIKIVISDEDFLKNFRVGKLDRRFTNQYEQKLT
jgi:hypothetical protein